ncbi:hypothetical protein N1027_06365 [Herbiconiux sp. CPCC 205763]|uniref:FtsX extracellular domain-containing protein n=1 Tax=Herbiconiux aconitum TaxID=2970913 RepID=A0ABT2GNF0_9MICO|nr:hypothetical protein [Herbiconiux aconitum]MCS5717757.1 hypothetical protein [Herbiconiux aconitum]
MDELDEALERAAPERCRDDSAAARSARALAVVVAAAHPRRKKRWGIVAAVVSILVLGGGATTAAATGMFDWSWKNADALSVQEFPVGEDPGGQVCFMALWAEADPGASAELNAAVEKAQSFLHAHDWSALDADTSNIWAKQRKQLVADGSATPTLLASLTAAQVQGDLSDAGLIAPGMMITSRVDCRDGAGE